MMTRAAMAALLSALVIGLVSDLSAQELVVSQVAIDKSTEVEKEATFHNRKWVLRTGQVSGFFICLSSSSGTSTENTGGCHIRCQPAQGLWMS